MKFVWLALSLVACATEAAWRHPAAPAPPPAPASCSGCTFMDQSSSKRSSSLSLWIDTDVDFDDLLSMLALFSPRNPQSLFLVSTTGCGASHIDPGIRNVLSILGLYPNRTIQHGIAVGASTPIQFSNVFPFAVRNCADILYHQQPFVPQPRTDIPVYENGTRHICAALADAAPASVAVLAIGGGTNLALARMACPESYARAVAELHAMGGTEVGAPGNVMAPYPPVVVNTSGRLQNVSSSPYANSLAEWNIFIDPAGFQIGFFDSFLPSHAAPDAPRRERSADAMVPTLVSLSACRHLPITDAVLRDLRTLAAAHPPAAVALGILSDPCVLLDPAHISAGMDLWDVLAAMSVLDASLLCVRRESLAVELVLREGNDTSGAIVSTGSYQWPFPPAVPRPVNLATCSDGARALSTWLDLLKA
eukprot:TRINITY_DN916_c0_g1_i1.p1 TRINITY_DN916_c0_g1~~TRINITY_DN916_c0_g1_i1.p1  ORF type:complete len:445 (-),score=91.22 TRINITY_DN916_c0_g1_i1:2343-3605(-)